MRIEILLSIIAAVTILAATWFMNGSEYEDAWLYLTAFWIVIIPLYNAYSKKSDGSGK
jgi:Zn-dependent protease with chaperone function